MKFYDDKHYESVKDELCSTGSAIKDITKSCIIYLDKFCRYSIHTIKKFSPNILPDTILINWANTNPKDNEKYELYKFIKTDAGAFNWFKTIGSYKDYMRDKISGSEYSFKWAYEFGDRDIMISKVIDDEWVYNWCVFIGDRDIMRNRIKSGYWAYKLALYDINEKENMINKIDDEESALLWAKNIGDADNMKLKIHSVKYAKKWKELIDSNDEYINNIIQQEDTTTN